MFKAGSIVGDLVLDTSGFTGGLQQAQGASAGFPSMIGANIIGPLLQALQVAQEVGRGIFEALQFGIGLAADFEVANVKLEVLLGSADKAKALLADLNKFAAETPFELPEIIQATQKLLAADVPADSMVETLRMLGDLALGDSEQFKELAVIYQKGLTGKITDMDLLQIADKGIPIYAELAKRIGVTKKEISEMASAGQIDMGMIQEAFKALTAEGGRFHDGTKRLAATFRGQWSTLKDTVNQGIRDATNALLEGVGAKGGLEGLIGDLGTLMPSLVEQAKEFGQSIGPDLKALAADAWSTLKEMWPDIQAAIRETIVTVRELIAEFRQLKEEAGPFGGLAGLALQLRGRGVVGAVAGGSSPFTAAGHLRQGLGGGGGPGGGGPIVGEVNIHVDPKATADEIARQIYPTFDEGVDAYVQQTLADYAARRRQQVAEGLGGAR